MAGLFSWLRKKERKRPFCCAIVVAAGRSVRMEGVDKMMAILAGRPVLFHTLLALEGSAVIDEIIVVTREDLIVPVAQLCKDSALSKVSKVIAGGPTRTQSVYAGVCQASPEAALIAIHDGARPLVPPEVIEAAVRRAGECGAAAPAVPLKDTVKRAHGGMVERTPEREGLFAVQTPQVFEASLIKAALRGAIDSKATLTDDCAAVERLGMTVALTEGSDLNMKITGPLDLVVAEALLDWSGAQ